METKRTAALLPAFYLEAHYQNVLAHLLENDFEVTLELPVPLKLSDGFLFGMGRIDLFVKHRITGQKFILELKANLPLSARQIPDSLWARSNRHPRFFRIAEQRV